MPDGDEHLLAQQARDGTAGHVDRALEKEIAPRPSTRRRHPARGRLERARLATPASGGRSVCVSTWRAVTRRIRALSASGTGRWCRQRVMKRSSLPASTSRSTAYAKSRLSQRRRLDGGGIGGPAPRVHARAAHRSWETRSQSHGGERQAGDRGEDEEAGERAEESPVGRQRELTRPLPRRTAIASARSSRAGSVSRLPRRGQQFTR